MKKIFLAAAIFAAFLIGCWMTAFTAELVEIRPTTYTIGYFDGLFSFVYW